MSTYRFRRILPWEVPTFFAIIQERIAWMNEKGIRQWNVTHYEEVYPLAYYAQSESDGRLFVLEDVQTGEIVCGAVLLEEDDRWSDQEPAVYLHNFAAKVGSRGAGEAFIRMAEQDAADRGKLYFRLDSAKDNKALAKYYDALGFEPVGSCAEGAYDGILRQKKLR